MVENQHFLTEPAESRSNLLTVQTDREPHTFRSQSNPEFRALGHFGEDQYAVFPMAPEGARLFERMGLMEAGRTKFILVDTNELSAPNEYVDMSYSTKYKLCWLRYLPTQLKIPIKVTICARTNNRGASTYQIGIAGSAKTPNKM